MGARPITVCVLVAALGLVPGCGGGGDGRKDAQQVVRDFVTAVNEKDGETFCKEITTREYVEQVTVAKGDAAVKQCETQIEQIRQPEFKLVKLVKTEVDGDRAVVTAELEQQGRVRRQVFRMVKEDGGFRLTSGSTN
ncbi:MAG TPA: DUF4878 domain-containing protein [Thermoleophilaceae bacterium]|nr:DUF4878 domain-containing protein [Thermoleophilaceae bacterium]